MTFVPLLTPPGASAPAGAGFRPLIGRRGPPDFVPVANCGGLADVRPEASSVPVRNGDAHAGQDGTCAVEPEDTGAQILALQAAHEAELAHLAQRHAEEVASLSAEACEAIAAKFAEALKESDHAFDKAVEQALAPTLVRLLSDRGREGALQGLLDAVAAIGKDGAVRRMELHGPPGLAKAFGARFPLAAEQMVHFPSDAPDLVVRIDGATLTTRIGLWLADLERVCDG